MAGIDKRSSGFFSLSHISTDSLLTPVLLCFNCSSGLHYPCRLALSLLLRVPQRTQNGLIFLQYFWREKKSKVKNNSKMLLYKFIPIILVSLFFFFKKRVCILSVSGPFPLGLCVMFWVFSGFMYIWTKALQKTCLKKKYEYEKRSFYSNRLWLCSPLHLALHFLTTRRQENQTGQLHVIVPYLSLYQENG